MMQTVYCFQFRDGEVPILIQVVEAVKAQSLADIQYETGWLPYLKKLSRSKLSI
jgi:hypothetical protein